MKIALSSTAALVRKLFFLAAAVLSAWHLLGYWLWIPGGPLWLNELREGLTAVAGLLIALGLERLSSSGAGGRARVTAAGALLLAMLVTILGATSIWRDWLDALDQRLDIKSRIAAKLLD
jgi:hypothetical protein